MKHSLPKRGWLRGVSLVETMIAIGILAVVGPLAVATLLKSGEGGVTARAETRSVAIVERCLSELKTARDGPSQYLPKLEPGANFGKDRVVCLAFAGDGTLLGKVDEGSYSSGSGKVDSQDAVYLAKLQGDLQTQRTGFPPLLTVTVTVEYPAVAPQNKRNHTEFHTQLP
ncbi:type IV pilus modification PilV family protein [Luteolibacter soli]|uniref:Prepilin-type N-terminal cleavage/methylation domain-containing protein n=1 Tax=Luteolibacter soli TaxID=3135280 RepID=A0ABU9AUT0_9BACT